jgi:hypothetical protein
MISQATCTFPFANPAGLSNRIRFLVTVGRPCRSGGAQRCPILPIPRRVLAHSLVGLRRDLRDGNEYPKVLRAGGRHRPREQHY